MPWNMYPLPSAGIDCTPLLSGPVLYKLLRPKKDRNSEPGITRPLPAISGEKKSTVVRSIQKLKEFRGDYLRQEKDLYLKDNKFIIEEIEQLFKGVMHVHPMRRMWFSLLGTCRLVPQQLMGNRRLEVAQAPSC